ncbi:MAG: hypothetical protein QXO15_05715 [Nitrososphaerota archaeon]
MGKRCLVLDCPYLAVDGTCLLPESELKEKCPARERVGYEEKDEWIFEDYLKERLRSRKVLE